jgi:phosphohistidine phosphatase
MLRLLLLRHAKAIPYVGRDDYERTLTERGRADAGLVAAYIAKQAPEPDLMIHSGAARTRETADIVARKLSPGLEVAVEPDIYDADRASLLRLLRGLPEDSPTVVVVGHNPGMAEVARLLTGRGDAGQIAKMSVKFPTSGVAIIEFPTHSWEDIGPRAGSLVAFVTPAALGGEDA